MGFEKQDIKESQLNIFKGIMQESIGKVDYVCHRIRSCDIINAGPNAMLILCTLSDHKARIDDFRDKQGAEAKRVKCV
jgi:hypothetical protein